jgi:hypothetical protein
MKRLKLFGIVAGVLIIGATRYFGLPNWAYLAAAGLGAAFWLSYFGVRASMHETKKAEASYKARLKTVQRELEAATVLVDEAEKRRKRDEDVASGIRADKRGIERSVTRPTIM